MKCSLICQSSSGCMFEVYIYVFSGYYENKRVKQRLNTNCKLFFRDLSGNQIAKLPELVFANLTRLVIL